MAKVFLVLETWIMSRGGMSKQPNICKTLLCKPRLFLRTQLHKVNNPPFCGLNYCNCQLKLYLRTGRLFGRVNLLKKPLYPIIAGICSSSAYGLVLFAMGYVTNVSFLQAFRQISLPVGFLAGVIILHEKPYRTKIAGVAIIVAGLLVMIFG